MSMPAGAYALQVEHAPLSGKFTASVYGWGGFLLGRGLHQDRSCAIRYAVREARIVRAQRMYNRAPNACELMFRNPKQAEVRA